MVSAAVGLEILFKSFNATTVGATGHIGEQYQVAGNPGHNLLRLFDAIPEATRDQLGFQTYRDYFQGRMGNLFILARYPYERDAIASGSNAIIEVAEEMFDRVMRKYKEGACDDPWIAAFPNV